MSVNHSELVPHETGSVASTCIMGLFQGYLASSAGC